MSSEMQAEQKGYDAIGTPMPGRTSNGWDRMGESIDYLRDRVDLLQDRLGKVLVPDTPHKLVDSVSPDSSSDLDARAVQIRALAERVNMLIMRLDL